MCLTAKGKGQTKNITISPNYKHSFIMIIPYHDIFENSHGGSTCRLVYVYRDWWWNGLKMDCMERLKVKRIVVFVAGFDIKVKVYQTD